MTPNLSLNASRRMYGTNDAIARLYSSPGRTRRQPNQNMNQSTLASNENSPYNRVNTRPAKQNTNHSSGVANENSPYNRLNVRPTNPTRPYNTSNQSHMPNRTPVNGAQLSANHSTSGYNRNVGQYTDSRSQGVSAGNGDNHYNSMQSQDNRSNDLGRRNLQNGYGDHSWQNGGSPKDFHSDRGHQSRNSSRPAPQYPESNSQHSNVQPSINYDSFGYATISHNKGPPPLPQRQGTSPQKQDTYGSPQSQYGQTQGNNQAGSHSPWQYVSNGRSRSATSQGARSEVKGPAQQVSMGSIYTFIMYSTGTLT
mgnify:FL=1